MSPRPGRDTPGGRGSDASPALGWSPGAGSAREPWSGERAERHLRSLELFGMRFGLDRMRRMMTVLGSPQRRFRAVHVVGTNGKTSTTRMIAAILQRHGLRTGAYLSPHLISYAERVQVAERELSSSSFAAAVARAAWAAERVNRTLAEDDHVTQFELLTAAAFWALAEREVEVAVVEAGLGGRYDATAVVESEVTVLTNVGLEHTRWLGPTVHDIATEKLAVLAPRTVLALGPCLHPDALAVARAAASAQRARIVQASVGRATTFPRRNIALAGTAARAYLQSVGVPVRESAIREAELASEVPGRLQVVADDPLTVLDGAHNPDAVHALVEALPSLLGNRKRAQAAESPPGARGLQYQLAHSIGVPPTHAEAPLALILGVLEDKDAAAMLASLLPLCGRAWFTAPPSPRALSPAALQSLARQQGFERAVCEPHPRRALRLAREWALARERPAVVLATGSIYLVGDLLAELREREALVDATAPAVTETLT